VLAQRLTVAFDAVDPAGLARFWAGLLDREVLAQPAGVLLPGSATQLALRFVPGTARRASAQPNRMHLHLTSTSLDDQQRRVQQARDAGAHHLDVGQRPEEGHVVLADPEGNEFCVIEPGNRFLAGCGLLGELACTGTRAVGRFWQDALGWPLVWDQDGETAIQSTRGGTKVAWDGQRAGGDQRQRLEVSAAAGDPQAEAERLVSLGAQRWPDGGLTDPDGNLFHLITARRPV